MIWHAAVLRRWQTGRAINLFERAPAVHIGLSIAPGSHCRSAAVPLRPRRQRWQRHQNGFGIAAGFEPENGAPVVEQIELDIAAPPDQLMAPLLLGPGEPHPGPDNRCKNRAKRVSDRANKGKVALPVATVEIVEKDPADAARLAPMLEEEVFVAPRLEALVAAAVVSRAGSAQRRVKFR